jgi:hypothetical protein
MKKITILDKGKDIKTVAATMACCIGSPSAAK